MRNWGIFSQLRQVASESSVKNKSWDILTGKGCDSEINWRHIMRINKSSLVTPAERPGNNWQLKRSELPKISLQIKSNSYFFQFTVFYRGVENKVRLDELSGK